jgi:hypothetical protein
MAPKSSAQSQRSRNPKTRSESAAAAVEMMISSKVDQPRFWATFRTVGAYEPRRPSGARRTTMPGTRASAPMAPARPSKMFPATAPITIASTACGSESIGTSPAAATITSRLTERFPQSSVRSKRPSTRRRSGTGVIPQLGVCCCSIRSLRWCEPDQVRRV